MANEINVKKVLFEGYAKKEGGAIKTWKKRYFRFTDDGVLQYFKDQTDAKALNSVDVTLCTGVQTNVKFSSHGFVVLTGEARDYRISCCNAEDCAAFLKAVQSKIPGAVENGSTAAADAEPVVVEPKGEETNAKEAKAEETKTEEAKAEETKTEEAKTEEAKTEEAKTEEAKAEETKAEEAKAEEQETEEQKTAEESKAEENKQGEAAPQSPIVTISRTGSVKASAAVVVAPGSASRSGWLMKSGGGKISAAFQRRYIQINAQFLTYAKTDKEGTACKGSVDLLEVQFLSIDVTQNLFNIGTLGRTYSFKAESAMSALEWVEHLNLFVPDGAQFSNVDGVRKTLQSVDSEPETAAGPAGELASPADDSNKDELIRTLLTHITKLEAQVEDMVLPKEGKEAAVGGDQEEKAGEAQDTEETEPTKAEEPGDEPEAKTE